MWFLYTAYIAIAVLFFINCVMFSDDIKPNIYLLVTFLATVLWPLTALGMFLYVHIYERFFIRV